MGKVVLPMDVCRLTLTQEFQVFKKLNTPIILGNYFLTEQKASIDFGNSILKIQNGLITTQLFSSPRKSSLARLVNRISIPPQSVVVAMVKVKGQNSGGLSMIEPIRTLPNKSHVIGARAIVRVDNSCMQIMNPTDEWVHLNKNEPVARVESIPPDHIVREMDERCDSSKTEECSKSDEEYTEIARSIGMDLTNANLSEDHKVKLMVFLGKNRDVFATDTSELGHTTLFPHKIDTGDAQPVRRRPYRYTPEQRLKIEQMTEEYEKHGSLVSLLPYGKVQLSLLRKRKLMITDLLLTLGE